MLSQDQHKELKKSIYKESYYEFFKDAYKELHPGQPFSDNWHIKYICDILQAEAVRINEYKQKKKDIIINIPFRSAKSLIVTVIFPVWCWTVYGRMKFICTSFSGSLALEHAGLSRTLMYSEWFKGYFGDDVLLSDDDNQKGFYRNKESGYRKSVGMGGQITGSGSDFIICLPEGQKVLTNKGYLDIKDIVNKKRKVKIASYNHDLKKIEYKNILRYDKNLGKKLIKIKTVDGEEMICTEDHEIWTENRGYIRAKDIVLNDTLLYVIPKDTVMYVSSIEYIDNIPDYVYNIEVEDNHNYFVNGILTHNCDDPQDPRMSASEVERKNVISFYNNVLYNRLNQPEVGVRIIVMQRLAEDDLSGYLLATSPEKHRLIRIPVSIESDIDKKNLSPQSLEKYYKDDLFWPDRFNKDVIQDFVSRLGSKESAGQLFQRPAPEEGNLVKRHWFDIIDSSQITLDLINSPIIFYLDTAETEKQEGDATGILCAFKKDNIVYVCNAVEVRKQFYELVKFIPEFVHVNKYTQNSKIKVEPKSSGKSVVSQLRASTMLNIVELPSPKDSKLTRLNAISSILESKRVKLIRGAYVDGFLDQLCTFPAAKHDDMVDAFIHCITDMLMESDFDFTFF